jgi:multidrug efflux pump subunit AcrB
MPLTRDPPTAALNELPVKVVNGATVYVRDVAHVRDGFASRPTSFARTGADRCCSR